MVEDSDDPIVWATVLETALPWACRRRAMIYQDRSHAGRLLAPHLHAYAGRHDVLVLGLPRGGVPVAAEVADALGAPLDVFVVRKLGMPGNEEVAMGAVASGGVRVLHADLVRQALAADPTALERVTERARRELERQERLYRGDEPSIRVTSQIAILVDDGMATGASMEAAVTALQNLHPGRLVVAVPVAPPQTCARLQHRVDEVVCPLRPEPFWAVGDHYAWFEPVEDTEVQALLKAAWVRQSA
jgi:putative phosphoribosyl transferase